MDLCKSFENPGSSLSCTNKTTNLTQVQEPHGEQSIYPSAKTMTLKILILIVVDKKQAR